MFCDISYEVVTYKLLVLLAIEMGWDGTNCLEMDWRYQQLVREWIVDGDWSHEQQLQELQSAAHYYSFTYHKISAVVYLLFPLFLFFLV